MESLTIWQRCIRNVMCEGGGIAVVSTGRLAAKKVAGLIPGPFCTALAFPCGFSQAAKLFNGNSNVSVGVSVGGSLSVWPHGRCQH